MTIKSVEFVFENCEAVDVPIDFIKYMWFGGVAKSLTMNPSTKTMQERDTISKFLISFMPNFKESSLKTNMDTDGYERLKKHMDICWIHLYNEDGSENVYGVEWKGDDQYTNAGQSFEEDDWGLVLELKSN